MVPLSSTDTNFLYHPEIFIYFSPEIPSFIPLHSIRCGRCIANCPAKLDLSAIDRAMDETNEEKKLAMLEKTGVNQCIECACCSYVCPAHRPILERNNEARAFMKNAKKKKEGGK